MADFDIRNDKTPLRKYGPMVKPTIAQFKAALSAFSASSYTAARMNAMTEQDLQYACRLHNLTVNTTF